MEYSALSQHLYRKYIVPIVPHAYAMTSKGYTFYSSSALETMAQGILHVIVMVDG